MDRTNVGVVQRGGGLCLTLEAGQSLSVLGYFIRQKFQGDEAMQLHILGLVHDTHSTAAELLDDAVMRNGLADHSAEMLGLEVRQVNEGVWRVSTGQLA